MALKQLKAFLEYLNEAIEDGITVAITFYDSRWKTTQLPRLTICQIASWLFQQVLPYADVTNSDENLLNDLEAKGCCYNSKCEKIFLKIFSKKPWAKEGIHQYRSVSVIYLLRHSIRW